MAVRNDYDVLIVGAGPAGSSLAIRAGRAGLKVALIDCKKFPRPKPCGEFLSPECLPILEDLDLRERLVQRGARTIAGMRLYGYRQTATGHFRDIGSSPMPFEGGYAISREILDHEIVLRAVELDAVEFHEGWTCRDLLRRSDGTITGVRATDRSGTEHRISALWTVGADGVRSRVARALGVQQKIPWLDKFALTSHFSGVHALPTAEVHMFAGGYFAAAPVNDDLLSLNLVVDSARLRDRCGDWDAFFSRHLERVPELSERMQNAERAAPVRGIGPLAYRTSTQAFGGAVLVGDACGYIDPITGEGIYFALRGAEILADSLIDAVHRKASDRSTMRTYVRRRRREVAPRLMLARLLQRGLQHPTVARSVLAALSSRPGLADLLVSMTGDYVRFREFLKPGVWWRALHARRAG